MPPSAGFDSVDLAWHTHTMRMSTSKRTNGDNYTMERNSWHFFLHFHTCLGVVWNLLSRCRHSYSIYLWWLPHSFRLWWSIPFPARHMRIHLESEAAQKQNCNRCTHFHWSSTTALCFKQDLCILSNISLMQNLQMDLYLQMENHI